MNKLVKVYKECVSKYLGMEQIKVDFDLKDFKNAEEVTDTLNRIVEFNKLASIKRKSILKRIDLIHEVIRRNIKFTNKNAISLSNPTDINVKEFKLCGEYVFIIAGREHAIPKNCAIINNFTNHYGIYTVELNYRSDDGCDLTKEYKIF